MSIRNITGAPVEGDDFYGREKEIKYAVTQIKAGNSLILPAPRRVGKSSFAKKVLDILKEEGWNTIEINLEEVKTEEDFARHFIESLQKQSWWEKVKATSADTIKHVLESVKPKVSIAGADVELEWKSKKTDVYEKLKELIDHNEKTIIMVDEVTILLYSLIKNEDGNGSAEFFLNWLRSFRQKSKTQIRWIFCSSIGIENFANQYSLSYSINDVSSFPIEAFSDKQATEFIRALFSSLGLPFEEKYAEYILEKIAWHLPFFIQIIINKVHYKIDVEEKEMSIALIDEAYNMLLHEKDFNTWDERLHFYSELEDVARRMLSKLAANPKGESRNSLDALFATPFPDEVKRNGILARTLTMLMNDGYLVRTDEDRYSFRSPLIRDFWNNRFNK